MSDIAIRVDKLSKLYRIGRAQQRHDTLRDLIVDTAKHIGHLGRRNGEPDDTIWALKDVSFEVERGEVVGIIGRNGAGKSTLLKILSRITEPTSGRAEIHGRVGSLLEVGTGFHPELTGRENIYLNGAILGMRRVEIDRRFDEIVAFSEIEKFLDTPVKRYSSGMYVRLAFAVAAHLEPEILLVDEVLAVGDAAFQKKCLGKMGDVAKAGRTVLFVSHNMIAVQSLCRRAVVLDDGKVSFLGDTDWALEYYVQLLGDLQESLLEDRNDRRGNQSLRFTRAAICDTRGQELVRVLSGQDVILKFYYVASRIIEDAEVHVSFVIRDRGYAISNVNSVDSGYSSLKIYPTGHFECRWNRFNLASGSYVCSLYCSINDEVTDWVEAAFTVSVENGDFFGSGKLIGFQGKVLIPHTWESHSDSTS